MNLKNIFNLPLGINAEEVFETLIKTSSVHLERIVSKGHTSPAQGWYEQDRDEWVIVLSGSAVLAFDNEPDINLKAGDYVNIPALKKHRVKWTDPEIETVWLALFYDAVD